jgi:hypothetical protein
MQFYAETARVQNMKVTPKKITYLLIAMALASFVQYAMWHISVWWALIGIAGLAISMLIEGPHGGSHGQIIAGTLASIAANSYQNFFALRGIAMKFFRDQRPPSIL